MARTIDKGAANAQEQIVLRISAHGSQGRTDFKAFGHTAIMAGPTEPLDETTSANPNF